jgi:hypothetical protein
VENNSKRLGFVGEIFEKITNWGRIGREGKIG